VVTPKRVDEEGVWKVGVEGVDEEGVSKVGVEGTPIAGVDCASRTRVDGASRAREEGMPIGGEADNPMVSMAVEETDRSRS
jgi:hypothetical protein